MDVNKKKNTKLFNVRRKGLFTFDCGNVKNEKDTADIYIKLRPNWKMTLSAITIGVGLVGLATSVYGKGASDYLNAETDALVSIGCMYID